MNIQPIYQKVLDKQITEAKFLQEVRADESLSGIITNTNTFAQTVTLLRNRGYIFDKTSINEGESFDFLGSVKVMTEAAKKAKLDADHANDYEFHKGWRYELDQQKEPNVEKAQAIALKNIEKDPIYYTRLLLMKADKKPAKRTDEPVEVNAGKTNVVDKVNALKPVKGLEKDKKTPKGPAEKASAKPKGVKQMKGGSGEVKSIKEGMIYMNPDLGNSQKDAHMINRVYDYLKNKFKISSNKEVWGKFHDATKEDLNKYIVDNIKSSEDRKNLISSIESKLDKIKEDSPSAGLSDKDKSAIAKKAQAGKDIGKKGKGFDKVEKKAEKEYGDKDTAKRVAAAAMWKNAAREDKSSKDEGIFSPAPDKTVKGKEVSFSVEDGTDPSKKFQVKKVVKSGKKNKDGSFELSFTNGDKMVMTNSNGGVKSLYFGNPGKPGDHDKVIDIDKNLEKVADIVFPSDKKKVAEASIDSNTKITGISIGSIRKDYGGGYAITGTVNGERRIQKLSKEDTQKGFNLKPADAMALAKKYLIDNFDEKANRLLKSKATQRDAIKTSNPDLNEYADDEKDEYDSIEDTYGTPEIKKLLDKCDNLGFDLTGEAMNAILTDKDFANSFDFKGSIQHGDITTQDLQKITDWRNSIVRKKTSEALRESIKKIIRKKLNEISQDITGPTVKKNDLKDLMQNYDWYYETSEDDSVKQRGQEQNAKVMNLVNQLGQAGVDIFNDYAPDDCKMSLKDIQEDTNHQRDLKDMENMSADQIADLVMSDAFPKMSIKNNAAVQILGKAVQAGNASDKVKQAFRKLADQLKEESVPGQQTLICKLTNKKTGQTFLDTVRPDELKGPLAVGYKIETLETCDSHDDAVKRIKVLAKGFNKSAKNNNE